jgi:hypothetical protein
LFRRQTIQIFFTTPPLLVFFSSKNENIAEQAGITNYARGLLSKRKLLYILHTRNSFVSIREEKEINQRE